MTMQIARTQVLPSPHHYCQEWEEDRQGSPMCYLPAVAYVWAMNLLYPVCNKHRMNVNERRANR